MRTFTKAWTIGLIVGAAASLEAADRYVAQSGQTPASPYNAGWTAAASNIQDAVNAAATNDTVWVGPGRYTVPANAVVFYGSTNVVYIDKPLTLRSSNGVPASVVVDGEGANRGIAWRFATANTNRFLLSGVTVSNCVATNVGAGILFVPNVWTATVQNCVITDNRVTWTVPDVTNILYGGGIYGYVTAGWGVTISNCVLRNNWVSNIVTTAVDAYGGGLYLSGYGGKLVTHCLIEDNIASSCGGGTVSPGGTFSHCTYRGNRTLKNVNAVSGGAAHYIGSSGGTFFNCLMYNNSAVGYGGAIHNDRASGLYIYNCTIVSNYGGTAGGINIRVNSADDALYMYNSIVYSNAAVDVAGAAAINYIANSCISTTNGTGILEGYDIITNRPAFANFAAQDFRLSHESPCVNAGTNQNWWMIGAVDILGNPRIDAGTGVVDMGCYEFQFPGGTLIMAR